MTFNQLRRREFIKLLGGAAVGVAAGGARAAAAMPVVGILSPQPRGPVPHLIDAFRRGLAEAGYFEGQSVAIEYHSTEGRFDRLARGGGRTGPPPGERGRHAGERARGACGQGCDPDDPDRLRRRPRTRSSSVWSPASPDRAAMRPASIFSPLKLVTKRLGLLHELLPAAARVAVLVNPANVRTHDVERAETWSRLRAPSGCKSKFYERQHQCARSMRPSQRIVRERPDALFVAPDGRSSRPGASNWSRWPRAMRFLRPIQSAILSRPAG